MVLLDSNGLQPTKHKGQHMKNKQTKLNNTSYDYRGDSYTRAYIAVDRLQDNKFIGYIPTKDEWIVATKFNDGAYGWSKYAMDMQGLEELLQELYPNTWESLLLSCHAFELDIELDFKTELVRAKRTA